jgi:hypothetical protein
VVKPVTVVFGLFALVMVAGLPLTCVQVPVPVTATFPAKVAVVALHTFWSGPALAFSEILTVTSEVEGVQAEPVIVQRNT